MVAIDYMVTSLEKKLKNVAAGDSAAEDAEDTEGSVSRGTGQGSLRRTSLRFAFETSNSKQVFSQGRKGREERRDTSKACPRKGGGKSRYGLFTAEAQRAWR